MSAASIDLSDPLPSSDTMRGRILRAAREHLFNIGYNSFTMDDLAHELGMSKKTLYRHFPSKEAIADAIIEHIAAAMRARLDHITTSNQLNFVEKLCAIIDTVSAVAFVRASPQALRDLQRFLPKTYERIERLRAQNIPLFFGRLIRLGIAEKKVRKEIDPEFAVLFWLNAVRGLIQPQVLEQTQLTLSQTLQHAVDIFFNGLLTPRGHLEYEKSALSKMRKRN
ncbi:MAG TPA: TetR/AcrR family transcriptional regulator [Opitutaceae bacterium]|nr:TetR/AcrR family transcriptional regulator [Opitutaceae bacterium]